MTRFSKCEVTFTERELSLYLRPLSAIAVVRLADGCSLECAGIKVLSAFKSSFTMLKRMIHTQELCLTCCDTVKEFHIAWELI